MADSKHSAIRMRQRGISHDKVQIILEHGRQFPVAGGAELCMVTSRQITDYIDGLKREIRRWEGVRRTAVVVGSDGDIITVHHHTRRHRVSS